MAISEFGDISTRTAAYAAADMLSHAEPVSVLAKFGHSKPLPKNKTDTIKYRRPVPFEPLEAPMAEGITPTPGGMQYEDVTVQMLQWGDLYGITDHIADMHEDPVLQDMSMLCGEQAQKTLERIIWNKVKAGTTVYYANGSARSDVNTALSLNDVRKAVRYLQSMKAKKLTKILSGSVNINTTPIEAAYVAFTHTDMQADIRGLAGFTPVAEYGSRQPLCAEEFGTVEDVRFITSPELVPFEDAGGAPGSTVVSTSGSSADVYPVVICGAEAYGLVPLKGAGSITPTVINPSTKDKSDPLGQRGYVGWKSYFNATVLNQTWMARIEAGASVLSQPLRGPGNRPPYLFRRQAMANIKVGTYEGTGAAINISLGFTPDYVKVWNSEDGDANWEWFNGLSANDALQSINVVDSGSSGAAGMELITSNGIDTYAGTNASGSEAAEGFTVGTALSESGKTFSYIAIGDAAG